MFPTGGEPLFTVRIDIPAIDALVAYLKERASKADQDKVDAIAAQLDPIAGKVQAVTATLQAARDNAR